LVSCLANSAERIEPLPATLALVEKVPDSMLDQFVGASIQPARKLLLHLSFQIRRWCSKVKVDGVIYDI
jgi:hypothetical protein